MRISEMSLRAVLAEPVQIILYRTRYVPGNGTAGVLEHWVADRDSEPEEVDLLFDNTAFALMADHFGGTQAANEALLGQPYAMMEPVLDDAGIPQRNADGTPMMTQAYSKADGEPLVGFNPPPNREKAVQDVIAIVTHRDPRAVGAAMMPDLINAYYTSILVAIQIGRGVDPTSAEATVRALLPLLNIDLSIDLNETAEWVQSKRQQEITENSPSENGPAPTAPPEEPSESSGDSPQRKRSSSSTLGV